MPLKLDGTPYTLEELRRYAAKIERQWIAMHQEVTNMTEHDIYTEKAINALSMQQERMAEDIKEINVALKSVAASLSNLAVLEQKHSDSMDAIIRAHKRIDALEAAWKVGEKEYTAKLQGIEIHLAKNVWIERVIGLIVAGVIALWVKGGL